MENKIKYANDPNFEMDDKKVNTEEYEDKFPSFDGTNSVLFQIDSEASVVRNPKTYEIDFNKVHHIEDIKLILKSMDLVFGEDQYEEAVGKLLKVREGK